MFGKRGVGKAGVCLATLGPGATKVYTYYDPALEVVGDIAARLTDFQSFGLRQAAQIRTWLV
jgi:hypothetical protein